MYLHGITFRILFVPSALPAEADTAAALSSTLSKDRTTEKTASQAQLTVDRFTGAQSPKSFIVDLVIIFQVVFFVYATKISDGTLRARWIQGPKSTRNENLLATMSCIGIR
jgi:hypothetical protein